MQDLHPISRTDLRHECELNCVCVVGEHDGVVKVKEWQKTYYTTDSGIQSGATSMRTDNDGTEFSKKYSYSTSVAENPAGEKQKRISSFNFNL